MSQITVQPLGAGDFAVEVEEGHHRTSHVVRVTDGLVDDLNIPDVDRELLVRESFAFLLEREPATSIMSEFSLDQISRYFPEYTEEILTRLS